MHILVIFDSIIDKKDKKFKNPVGSMQEPRGLRLKGAFRRGRDKGEESKAEAGARMRGHLFP